MRSAIAGATKFQPVYVGDVADAVMAAIARPDAVGATYELGGPRVWTMRELMAYILAQTGRDKILVNVPMCIARMQAADDAAAAWRAWADAAAAVVEATLPVAV